MKKPAVMMMLGLGLAAAFAGEQEDKRPDYLSGLIPLTSKRIPMKPELELPCAVGGFRDPNPHNGSDMIVHANKVLLDYVRANHGGVEFPVGSVLLKEKFKGGDLQGQAELFTRMERMGKVGEVSDWKFSAKGLNKERRVAEKVRTSRCVSCHEDFDKTGFVSEESVKLLREFVKLSK